MTDMAEHERAIRAARAGVVAARALELPPEAPDDGVTHDYEKQLRRIERTLEKERDASRNLRRAVVRWGRTTTFVVRGFIVLVVVLTFAGAFGYQRMETLLESTTKLAQDNRDVAREAAAGARDVIRDACRSQNADRAKLRVILKRGEATIPKLVREGTLTQAQARRALDASARARRELHGDDCAARAARIPLPRVKS